MRTNTLVVFATSGAVSLSQHQSTTCQREVGKWVSRRVTQAAPIWANGSTGQCYVPAFWRPAPAAELACTSRWQPTSVLFPPNLHLLPGEHYSSAGAAEPSWAGTGGDQTGVDACSRSNDWMSSIHPVSKHLEHASSSTQPTRRLSHTKSRCHTSTSPALPDLASLAAPSGPRIGQWPKKQSRSDEPNRARAKRLFDGQAPLRRETHPGFTTHHAPSTWTCLGLLGLRNHGSTAEPACHCSLAAVPRFVCMSHTPNSDTLALDRPIPKPGLAAVSQARQANSTPVPFVWLCLPRPGRQLLGTKRRREQESRRSTRTMTRLL